LENIYGIFCEYKKPKIKKIIIKNHFPITSLVVGVLCGNKEGALQIFKKLII